MTRKDEGAFLCNCLFYFRERKVSGPVSGKGQEKQLKRLPSSLVSILMLLSGALLPSWVAMVTWRARFSWCLGKHGWEALREASVVPVTTKEQGRRRCPTGVGRSQGPTTESGPESTLDFNLLSSDLTCSRWHSTLAAKTLLEPRCPRSAQHSVHHFPLLVIQEANYELKRAR